MTKKRDAAIITAAAAVGAALCAGCKALLDRTRDKSDLSSGYIPNEQIPDAPGHCPNRGCYRHHP